MEIWQIITGCIVSMTAVASGVYASFTARCKGPILSNTYLWLSKQEKELVDKKAEYQLVTVIFGCLTAVFAFLALHIFTLWKWPYILMWIVIAFAVIYAIVDSVKTEKNKSDK